MNKSTIALIAGLCFFLGAAIGTITGFLISPIKNGLAFNMSFNDCGNKNKTVSEKKKSKSGKKLGLPAIKTDEKGKRKWIGRK